LFVNTQFSEEVREHIEKELTLAIKRGSELYNEGKAGESADYYVSVAEDILKDKGHECSTICHLEECTKELNPLFDPLARAIFAAESCTDHHARAWTMRRGFDFYFYNRLIGQ